MYFRTLQREPTSQETQAVLDLVTKYQASPSEAWAAAIRMLMASNEFHFID
jgi:hypothetical protein